MRIDFDAIECGSAFRLTSGQAARSIGPQLELVTLPDILFLPHALDRGQSICLAQQRVVPLEAVLDCWNVDFFKRKRRELRPSLYSRDFNAETRSEEVCILGNLFSRNFGHWTEELLKVAVLEKAGVDCAYVIPDLPTFARDSLAFLGVPPNRVIVADSPILFAHGVFTTATSHENLAQSPAALWMLRELVASKLGNRPTPVKRLWLERKELVRNGGGTANPEPVHALVREHGFEVLDMATLSFGDQLAAASGCNVMAGVHGAQFVHAQFMQAKSTVIECFSPIHVNPSILQICRALGHSYHQIVARSHLIEPYVLGRDCLVDCELLEMVLHSLDQ